MGFGAHESNWSPASNYRIRPGDIEGLGSGVYYTKNIIRNPQTALVVI